MFKKTLLLTALCASSIGMSGCSSMWNMASEFSADMAEVTKFSFLRGSSKKDDISFAETAGDVDDGVYKTDVGEYVPTETYASTYTEAYTETRFETDGAAAMVDTSPHPCPDGTYFTEDETCMSLDVDTYDFGDLDNVAMTEQFVDTSQHECPEDTYLNDKNQCMYFETETFDFEDDVSFIQQTVDTSPHPCPEDTYMTAEGACMVIDNEPTDFALNSDDVTTDVVLTTAEITPTPLLAAAASAAPANAFATNLSVQCPESFTANADNSCTFQGAKPQK